MLTIGRSPTLACHLNSPQLRSTGDTTGPDHRSPVCPIAISELCHRHQSQLNLSTSHRFRSVLIMAGLTPAQAICQIRTRRSPSALFNECFVD